MLKLGVVLTVLFALRPVSKLVDRQFAHVLEHLPEYVVRFGALAWPADERQTWSNEWIEDIRNERKDLEDGGASPFQVWRASMANAVEVVRRAPGVVSIATDLSWPLRSLRLQGLVTSGLLGAFFAVGSVEAHFFSHRIGQVEFMAMTGIAVFVAGPALRDLARNLDGEWAQNLIRRVILPGAPGVALVCMPTVNAEPLFSVESVLLGYLPGGALLAAALSFFVVPRSVRPWLRLLPLISGIVVLAPFCLLLSQIARAWADSQTPFSSLLRHMTFVVWLAMLCARETRRLREDVRASTGEAAQLA